MDKNFVYGLLIGACIGSVGAFMIAKKHYEKIAEEEINQIVRSENKKAKITTIIENHNNVEPRTSEVEETTEDDDVSIDSFVMAESKADSGPVYVIGHDEFESNLSFDSVSLNWWNNGVLTDIDDIEFEESPAVLRLATEAFERNDEEYVVYIRSEGVGADYCISRTGEDWS